MSKKYPFEMFKDYVYFEIDEDDILVMNVDTYAVRKLIEENERSTHEKDNL